MTKPTAEHLDWRSFMTAADDTDPKIIRALDTYFPHFCAIPIKDGEGGKKTFETQQCVGCGETLTGFAALIGRGGFRWGIVHGEGNCSGCGWPCRAHHFIKDEDGKDVTTLHNFVLQVHPDFVGDRKTEAA